MIMCLIRKTNQTNPERLTEKLGGKRLLQRKGTFSKTSTIVLDKRTTTLAN